MNMNDVFDADWLDCLIVVNSFGSLNNAIRDANTIHSLAFNERLKERIRNRDGRCCRVCGKSELLNHGKRLPVHHIDGDKINCNQQNLLTLCNTCHGRTCAIRANSIDTFLNKIMYNKFVLRGVITP